MFMSRNRKTNVYPCKPQFYCIKEGFLRRSKLYRRVFVMGHILDSQGYKVFSCRQQRLIRLCKCTGQFESSLGVHVKEYVFSCCGPFIWILFLSTSRKHAYIILTPLNPSKAVLMSTYNLCFEQKYEKISESYLKTFSFILFYFFVVKFSIYLNRLVFVM